VDSAGESGQAGERGHQINAVNFSQRAQKTLKTNLWICKPTPALIYVHLGKENWEPMLGKNKY